MASVKRLDNSVLRISPRRLLSRQIDKIKSEIPEPSFDTILVVSVDADLPLWEELFAQIGKLQTRTLKLNGEIPMMALSKLVNTNFEILELDRVIFHDGANTHVSKLCETVLSIWQPKQVKVRNFCRKSNISHDYDSFVRFLKAILSSPSLLKLDWVVQPRCSDDWMLLDEMTKSRCLHRMEISISYTPSQVLDSLYFPLDSNAIRSRLCIWVERLGLLQGCSLKYLLIDGQAAVGASIQGLEKFLKTNQTLEELKIPVLHIAYTEGIIRSLNTNRTLKHLEIYAKDPSNSALNLQFNAAVAEMLKGNSVLLSMKVKCGLRNWKKSSEVVDYLVLNRAGRDRLLKNEIQEEKDWVDAIMFCHGLKNLTGIFVFLRQNPSLVADCEVPNNPLVLADCKAPPAKKRTKKRRRLDWQVKK